MLKLLPPVNDYGCGLIKSKCAEIYFQTSKFSILCISCGMTTLVYTEFLEHFQSKHFTICKNAQHIVKDPAFANVFGKESNPVFHDPLEPTYVEETDDTEEALKILQTSKHERKTMNPSSQYGVTSHLVAKQSEEDVSVQQPGEDEKSCDEQYLCKIKMEEVRLMTTSDGDLNISTSSNTENFCCDHQISAIFSDVDKEVNLNVKVDSVSEGVDWSKPYEPNLLRNHDKRPYKPRNKPHICTYCGRTFRRRHQLDTHLNIHTGMKPHQCEVCGRQFRAITTLTRHLNTHGQRESLHCRHCTKPFTHRAALLSHELRHTQQRRIPCDECDKCFYTNNQMDTHKRKVHHKSDDNDLPFACELCTKRYRSASMLSTHKFKKHYKTAKIFCEHCGKKFIDDEQLENHKGIHVLKK